MDIIIQTKAPQIANLGGVIPYRFFLADLNYTASPAGAVYLIVRDGASAFNLIAYPNNGQLRTFHFGNLAALNEVQVNNLRYISSITFRE